MSIFFYPIKCDRKGHEVSAQHLKLTALGIEVYDFDRPGGSGGYIHTLDDRIDTVTAIPDYDPDTVSPPAVLRDNDADFALSGAGRYFAANSKVMARRLIGRDLHDLYEYVYAVDEVRQGTGESLVGPAMRAVEEAQVLGFGLAVVPERIRQLARQGYEGWIAQANDSARDGDLAAAYVELEHGMNGLARLGRTADLDGAVAALNAELAASAKDQPARKKLLLAESARLASALTSVEQAPVVADEDDGMLITAARANSVR